MSPMVNQTFLTWTEWYRNSCPWPCSELIQSEKRQKLSNSVKKCQKWPNAQKCPKIAKNAYYLLLGQNWPKFFWHWLQRHVQQIWSLLEIQNTTWHPHFDVQPNIWSHGLYLQSEYWPHLQANHWYQKPDITVYRLGQ